MKKLVKDCLTGIDNQTYDFMRVFTCVALLVYFAMQFFSIDETWNPVQFAEGFGLIMVATGASLHLKRETEPKS
jgi:hypothetical protein